MKYKNIYSAIHNFGRSFTSSMNYVDGEYVMDELAKMHTQDIDIEVDWQTGVFSPATLVTPRVQKSIGYWKNGLKKQLVSQNVELEALTELKFRWPAGERKHMLALDDRGKEYKIFVNESK